MEIIMKCDLKYGNKKIKFEFDSGTCIGILKPVQDAATVNEKEIVEKALQKPVKSKKIEKFVKPKDRVLIVVPDKTRLSRLNIVLPIVLQKLENIGVKDENIKFIFANGSHGAQTEEEKRAILGKEIIKKYQVLEHDAFDFANHLYFGKTPKGTHVYLNKFTDRSEKIITIGSVTHHYFAGFGGGAKMIMPGLAYYKTIEQNHKRSLSKKPGINRNCKSGTLKNNPIYEDIIQVIRMCPPIYSICLMLNEKGAIASVSGGDPLISHLNITEKVNEKYRIKIDTASDLVICSAGGYPKDINIIQTHKTIYNAYQAVKSGGVIICLAECTDGIGSKTFMDWFRYSKDELKINLFKKYSLNAQTAVSIMEKAEKVKIILVSKMDAVLVKEMGMIPAKSIDEAMRKAKTFLPKDFDYYVIPNGSITVPYIK